ncbi:hypothetical protein [Bradyrhizobium sp. USDA 4353]
MTSRFVRFVKLQLVGIIILFMAAIVVGAKNFPDAPIRPCGEQFCGRSGELHSEMEFKRYRPWERTTLSMLPVMLGSVGLLVWLRRRKKNDVQRLLVKQRDLSPAVEELRYEGAWTSLKWRKTLPLAIALVAALTAVATRLVGYPGPALPFMLVMLLPAALFLLGRFACPRCDERFSLLSPAKCHCCGLRYGTTFQQSLKEVSERTFACH